MLGLATDYCVKFTALDARALGFDVAVIADGCRAVELAPGDGARVRSDCHVATSADACGSMRAPAHGRC